MIYFLQRQNGDIKIGATTNYKGRYSALAAKHGELTLLGAQPGSYEQELALHNEFAEYRIGRSEFFMPSAKLLNYIQENTSTEIPKETPVSRGYRIECSPDAYEALKEIAADQQRPLADLIREALRDYAKKHGRVIDMRIQHGGKRQREL